MRTITAERSLKKEIGLCLVRFLICLLAALVILSCASGANISADLLMQNAPVRSLVIYNVAFNLFYLLFTKRASTAYAEEELKNKRSPFKKYLRRVYLTQLAVILGVYLVMVVPLYLTGAAEQEDSAAFALFDVLLGVTNLASFALINPPFARLFIRRYTKEYNDRHVFDR